MHYTVPNCNECDHKKVCKRRNLTSIITDEVSTIVSIHESDHGININIECEDFKPKR